MRVADLSHYQNVTNYDLFRPFFDGYYIKVTQASNYVDSAWDNHYRGLGGKPRAPYHFMGKREDWAKQVRYFIDQYSKVNWEWGPVLDAEFDSKVQAGDPTSDDIKGWVAEWRKQTGKNLIYVYLGRSTWLSTAPPSQWADSGTRIIGARYRRNNFDTAFEDFGLSHPYLDGVQYWNSGTAPGLNSFIDLNNFKIIITEKPRITTPPPPVGDEMPLSTQFEIDYKLGRASASFECGYVAEGGNSIVVKELWAGAKTLWGDLFQVNVVFQNDEGSGLLNEVWDFKSNKRKSWKAPSGSSTVTFEWNPETAPTDFKFSPYIVAR